MLQIHTLPDPTPTPTIVPLTDECDGRYSDGTHSKLLPACWIHIRSELKPVPTCKGRAGSSRSVMLDFSKLWVSMDLIAVRRRELLRSNDKRKRPLPTSSVCTHAPLLASQILTVLSSDADASRVESCEKATELTQPLQYFAKPASPFAHSRL
jgi:hypothetical protein